MLRSFAPAARVSLAALAALASPAWSLDPHKSLTQYTRAVSPQANGVPQDTISAIAQTTDGYLGVGTDDGLARFGGYNFVTLPRTAAPCLVTRLNRSRPVAMGLYGSEHPMG
jgi:ligand-binding sensor domain-containing protein